MPAGSCKVIQDGGVPTVAPAGFIATVSDAAKHKIKVVILKVEGGVMYLQGLAGEAVFFMKVKLSALAETPAIKALEPYRVKLVASMVQLQGRVTSIVLRVREGGELGTQRLIGMYSSLCMLAKTQAELAANRMANARLMVTNGAWRVVGPCITFAKDGYSYAVGRMQDAVIRVKMVGDAVRQQAVAAYVGACQKLIYFLEPILTILGELSGSISANFEAVFKPYLLTIKNGVLSIKAKFGKAFIRIQLKLSETLKAALATVEPCLTKVRTVVDKAGNKIVFLKDSALTAFEDSTKVAQLKIAQLSSTVKTTISSERFKATAGSAVVGVAAGGASGGSAGFVAGGAVGAAIGVVPAIFTFGLSIPIGAALGSGAGLCIGTAAGSTAGLVGGGAAGYGVQKHKTEISQGMVGACAKVAACKDSVKSYAKTKLVGATGGTDSSAASLAPPAAVGGTEQ